MNPFGEQNGRRPPPMHIPYKWENNIKIELPEFNGSLKPEEFVDWLIEESKGNPTPSQPPPDKPEQSATAEEMAAWLTAFSDPKRKRR